MLKKNLILLIFYFCSFLILNKVNAQTFRDVYSTHPYYNAIESLAEQEILNGYPDQTFKPENAINRAELLKVLLLGSDVDVEETTYNGGFPDVISNSWYAKYVVKAKEASIIQGNPDGYFYPDNQINFAETLKMLVLANQIEVKTNLTENPFLDVSQNAWYAPYFDYAKSENIIKKTGKENANPSKLIDRGEAAQLIFLFQEAQKTTKEDIFATYYADSLDGEITASSEIFDQDKLTAAHKTLAFGTRIKVTNLENGESVIVTINDRGPYSSNASYVLDLSKSAFQSISPLSRGVIKIKYEIIETNEENEKQTTTDNNLTSNTKIVLSSNNEEEISCPSEEDQNPIKSDFFENITLTKDIPNVFQKNEIYNFTGTLSDINYDVATVFLINVTDTTEEYRFVGETNNGNFDIPVLFNKTGIFNLGVLRGDSGQSFITEIKVIPSVCITNITDSNATIPTDLKIKYDREKTLVSWNNHAQQLSKVTIRQGNYENSYILNNSQTSLEIPYQDFENFSQGEAFFSVAGSESDSDFSLGQSTEWATSAEKSFLATKHYQSFNNFDEIEINNLIEDYVFGEKISLTGKSSKILSNNAFLILPTGLTQKISLFTDGLSTNSLEQEIVPANQIFQFNHTPLTKGTYILEINKDDGFAIINMPIYESETIPLIPDIWDLNGHYLNLKDRSFPDLEDMQNDLLDKINQSREEFGADSITIDANLKQLAQSRAEDMAKNNYLSHQNLQEKYVNDLKVNYGIKSTVSENISKDVDIDFTHAGLMRSAIHRKNILNQKWTRVGLGIAENSEGYLIVVEIFSDNEISETDLPHLRSQILETINLKRSVALLSDSDLNEIAQEWSENILNRSDVWFEDPDTGIALSYLLNSKIGLNKQSGSTILKGSFDPILEEIDNNDTVIDEDWEKIGIGFSQNNNGSLNVTMVYSN